MDVAWEQLTPCLRVLRFQDKIIYFQVVEMRWLPCARCMTHRCSYVLQRITV